MPSLRKQLKEYKRSRPSDAEERRLAEARRRMLKNLATKLPNKPVFKSPEEEAKTRDRIHSRLRRKLE